MLHAGETKSVVKAKEDEVRQKLSEERSWAGSSGTIPVRLNFSSIAFPEGLREMSHADHEGAVPFAIAMKNDCRRHGPVAVPCLGPPFLLFPSRDMFVHLYPAGSLCEQGIPLPNFEHYLSTPEGVKKSKAHSCMVFAAASSVLFVPAGMLATLVFHKELPKKTKSSDAIEMASAVLAPFPATSLLAKLSASVRSALLTWNTDATSEKKQAMW